MRNKHGIFHNEELGDLCTFVGRPYCQNGNIWEDTMSCRMPRMGKQVLHAEFLWVNSCKTSTWHTDNEIEGNIMASQEGRRWIELNQNSFQWLTSLLIISNHQFLLTHCYLKGAYKCVKRQRMT